MDTLNRNQVSDRAKRLVEEIRDVIRVEEAWAVAQRYLDEEALSATFDSPASVAVGLPQVVLRSALPVRSPKDSLTKS